MSTVKWGLREAVPQCEGKVGVDGCDEAESRSLDFARDDRVRGVRRRTVSTDALPQRLKPIIFKQVHAGLKACSAQKRMGKGLTGLGCGEEKGGRRTCRPRLTSTWADLDDSQTASVAPLNRKKSD